MSKSFKIARKPGQGTNPPVSATSSPSSITQPSVVKRKGRSILTQPVEAMGLTTRKTIEVPEEYFYKVKMRALERKILEKELWAEILAEYFANHPTF